MEPCEECGGRGWWWYCDICHTEDGEQCEMHVFEAYTEPCDVCHGTGRVGEVEHADC